MKIKLYVLLFLLGGCANQVQVKKIMETQHAVFDSNNVVFLKWANILGGNDSNFEDKLTLVKREKLVFKKKNIIYNVDIEQSSNNRFVRIYPDLDFKTNCLSYSFVFTKDSAVIALPSKRNVIYRKLEHNWYIEVDGSSPCFDD